MTSCSRDRVTAVGLDIGSVNCGLGVIEAWGHGSCGISIEELGQYTCKVPDGVKATSAQRLHEVECMMNYPNEDFVTIVGIEGYTNQSRSFTSFSIGEMGGYVRKIVYDSKITYAVIIPPIFLNSLCGAGGRGLSHSKRKRIIADYLKLYCCLQGDNEHTTDALGYAWLAYLALIWRWGYPNLVKDFLPGSASLIASLQDKKHWLKVGDPKR